MNDAAVIERGGVRIEADRLRQFVHGAVEIAVGGVGLAARVKGGGQGAIDLGGLVEIGDSAVIVALFEGGDAAVIERGGTLADRA